MRKLALAMALCAMVSTAFAAESPFTGTWKLNPAKSHYTGYTFVYKQMPNGMIHDNDGSIQYDFKVDGTAYPMLGNRTVTWTKTGENSWNRTVKADDQVLAQSTQVLSADGKTMTVRSTITRADGTTFKNDSVLERTAGGPGLDGTWKDVKAKTNSNDIMVYSRPDADSISMSFPQEKISFQGKLDGSPTPVTGPTLPSGFTSSMTMSSAGALEYKQALNDKVIIQGIQKISADGNTLTDTSWDPTLPNEKTIEIYEKQ